MTAPVVIVQKVKNGSQIDLGKWQAIPDSPDEITRCFLAQRVIDQSVVCFAILSDARRIVNRPEACVCLDTDQVLLQITWIMVLKIRIHACHARDRMGLEREDVQGDVVFT